MLKLYTCQLNKYEQMIRKQKAAYRYYIYVRINRSCDHYNIEASRYYSKNKSRRTAKRLLALLPTINHTFPDFGLVDALSVAIFIRLHSALACH